MKSRVLVLLALTGSLSVACRDVTEPNLSPVHSLAPQAAALSWATMASMSAARQNHVAVTGADGRIYMIGGTDMNGWTAGSEVFNPGNNSWAPIASPGPWCCGGSGRGLNGRIYIAAGENDGVPTNAVKVYDPATNSWSDGAPLSVTRDVTAMVADSNGLLYAIGGAENGDSRRMLNSVEVYDPTAGSWSEVAPMGVRRWYHAAALGQDGRIYVFGGMTGFTSLSSAEVYDPTANTWSPIAPMPETRYGQAAVTGGDGRIWVMGGTVNDGGTGRSVLVYDPQTDTWESAPSMNVGRTQLAATLGLDNKIYVAGGYSPPSAQVTASAESYETVLAGPPNQPPVAFAGADRTLQCVDHGANARLDGSSSTDPESDPLTFAWFDGSTSLGTSAVVNTRLALGVHSLNLRVTDSKQASTEDGVVVTVNDTKAPAIFVQRFDQFVSRLPENGYKLVARIKAQDQCQNANLNVTVSRTRLFGFGDDSYHGDRWNVVANNVGGFDVYLHAEDDYFHAIMYTIKSVATDGSGNSATVQTFVNAIILPHVYLPFGKLRFGH